jgi:hypothetical protein
MDSMSTNLEFHPLKDLTFFASLVTAFLFSVGFLYETVYLEGFRLNNSELAPDISTSIIYGFRYAFLNGVSGLLSIITIGLCSLIAFDGLKKDLTNFFNNSEYIKSKSQSFINFFTYKPSPFYFIIGLCFLAILILLHAIQMGKNLAVEIKEENSIECISISVNSSETSYEGHTVRIRDGLIVFWEKSKKTTHIFTQKNLINIAYSEGCPNKSLKQDR